MFNEMPEDFAPAPKTRGQRVITREAWIVALLLFGILVMVATGFWMLVQIVERL